MDDYIIVEREDMFMKAVLKSLRNLGGVSGRKE